MFRKRVVNILGKKIRPALLRTARGENKRAVLDRKSVV